MTENRKMKEILEHPDKHINDAKSSVLSTIFRKLLILEDVTPEKFNRLMGLWTNNSKVSITPGHRRSQARGNIEKELTYANMSWAVLVKGFRFLAYNRIKIQITAYNDKTHKQVSTGVEFRLPDNYDELDLMRGGLYESNDETTTQPPKQPLQKQIPEQSQQNPPSDKKWWQQT